MDLRSRGVDALSDEALLAGLGSGDKAAAAAFVRRFERRVFGLALSIVRDSAVAEDVAQEAFTRAWRHAQAYDARRGSVVTWLLTITRNLALDTLRMRRPNATAPDALLELVGTSGERGPAEEAVAADESRDVRAALARLPVDQRRALVLAVFGGRTAKEIAEEEGIPLGTAKTRIRAGLIKLRGTLANEVLVP